ncbi:hypothetical protein PM082_010602 [Marasmius tenuissimus]|nr:hypothetical protein PM082_010602 [Marasmius tenuissimus]
MVSEGKKVGKKSPGSDNWQGCGSSTFSQLEPQPRMIIVTDGTELVLLQRPGNVLRIMGVWVRRNQEIKEA